MCKRNNIFYERNIELVFAHVNSMCKRSNISYERNIKFMFAHVNHMCKRSNILFLYGSMPKDVFSLTPPQPMSNVASCRCASAKERY